MKNGPFSHTKGMKKKRKLYAEKRVVAVCAAFAVTVAGIFLRLTYVQHQYSAAGAWAGVRSVLLAQSRGMIVDRFGRPLVNAGSDPLAVVLSSPATASLLQSLSGSSAKKADGVLYTVPNVRLEESAFCKNVSVVRRYEALQPAVHVLGYLDGDGKGVCGVELAFDRILKAASGTLSAQYTAGAGGEALAGAGLTVVSDGYCSKAGVMLTIDREIQLLTERALADGGIEQGAAVVMDAETCDILAIASTPVYDPENVEKSLSDGRLPFIDRALEAYPVGSVMKPLIAAAALENGVETDAGFTCTGAADVGETHFTCYHGNAHGREGLDDAIANSCNCYFIDLAQRTGAAAIIKTANSLGLGEKAELCSTLASAAGTLPESEGIAPAELANFSFGQGRLLATPLQMAAAYSAIANGGVYRAPRLMKALLDDEAKVYAEYRNETERRVLTEETCQTITRALQYNMTDGTGKNGASPLISAAGKTATAQTGRPDSTGAEQLCTWFCGCFPAEEPLLTVVVFNEYGTTAAKDCAPVFRAIVEGICG